MQFGILNEQKNKANTLQYFLLTQFLNKKLN